MTSINAAWEAASQDMNNAMNQQGGAGAQGGAEQPNTDAGKSENVTDVDYEEVK